MHHAFCIVMSQIIFSLRLKSDTKNTDIDGGQNSSYTKRYSAVMEVVST